MNSFFNISSAAVASIVTVTTTNDNSSLFLHSLHKSKIEFCIKIPE